MKKLFALLLSLLLTVSLMACGGETQPAHTAEPTAIQPTESPEETNSVGPLTADCIAAAFEAAMQALSDK